MDYCGQTYGRDTDEGTEMDRIEASIPNRTRHGDRTGPSRASLRAKRDRRRLIGCIPSGETCALPTAVP